MTQEKKITDNVLQFAHRLDFYWKFLSVYAITLVAYILFVMIFLEMTLKDIIKDPVVLLLALFILISGIGLLINMYRDREIIVGEDFITFRNRLIEKTYKLDDIVSINFGKEKNAKIHGDNRIIKIKVKNRRRLFRIKPNTFWNDKKLVKSIANLKKNLLEKE